VIEFARRLATQRPPLWIRFLLVPGWRDDYGAVKMNVDTDIQYVFTRVIAGQMFKN
jgi:pyruvate-formate lyase-activating enzyme